MEDKFQPLDNEEVISVANNDKLLSDSMFTSGQLVSTIKQIARNFPNAKPIPIFCRGAWLAPETPENP
jgi:hypothetical protein